MEKDFFVNGVRIRGANKEIIKDRIYRNVITRGMNYVDFAHPSGTVFSNEDVLDIVRYTVENKIYFTFYYERGRGRKKGNVEKPMWCDNETLRKVQEIAGPYFLGLDVGGEIMTEYACVANGYWPNCNDADNMTDAKNNICKVCKDFLDEANPNGDIPVFSWEQTGLISYAAKQGMTYPAQETCTGSPEIMLPFLRGTARAMNAPMWANYVAHEWYNGVRNLDPLKMKRLKLTYDWCYMSGSNLLVIEGGQSGLFAHDCNPNNPWVEGVVSRKETPYGYYHPISQQYRKTLYEFADFAKSDCRPKGGPRVDVAFVQGNLDGYSPWRCGSSLWGCYEKEEFGYSTPEFVWRVMDDLATKRPWTDIHNFGDVDLSGAPAYGTYDIINAADGYETFSRYKYLIFTGWNTMTEEIYDNLVKFVRGGGRLFMTAAHLNTSDKRNGEMKLIHDGDVSELFGCKLDASNPLYVNNGYKFVNSIVPEFMYPRDLLFDPLFAEGYIHYPQVTMCGGSVGAIISDRFREKDGIENQPVWLAENKVGDGYAVLMTNLDYPGSQGYLAYRNMVREIVTASHRQADVKVYGSGRLLFTVYEGGKIYLLNTDYDCKTHAIIDYGDEKREFLLEPCELRVVER